MSTTVSAGLVAAFAVAGVLCAAVIFCIVYRRCCTSASVEEDVDGVKTNAEVMEEAAPSEQQPQPGSDSPPASEDEEGTMGDDAASSVARKNWTKAQGVEMSSIVGFRGGLDSENGSSAYAEEPLDESQTAVVDLIADMLPVLARAMDVAVKRDEPKGYGTKWWHGRSARQVVVSAEEELRRQQETRVERRQREEREAEEAHEILKYGPAPTTAQREREEERRRRARLGALSHGLEAIALLRARTDLLIHRLTRIEALDDSTLRRLAESIVRYTPISGELDQLPEAAGAGRLLLPRRGGASASSASSDGGPFTRGSSFALSSDPAVLAMEILQVEKLAVETAAKDEAYVTIPGRPLLPALPSGRQRPAAILTRDELPPLPQLSGLPLPYDSQRQPWRPPSSSTLVAAAARRGQTISDMMGSDSYQLDESVSFADRIKAIPELGLPDPKQDEGVDEQHLYSHGSFDTQASDPDAFKSRPPGSYYDAAPPSYAYE